MTGGHVVITPEAAYREVAVVGASRDPVCGESRSFEVQGDGVRAGDTVFRSAKRLSTEDVERWATALGKGSKGCGA